MSQAVSDPRTQLAQAADWVASLVDQVTPDRLGRATPCTDYDVRGLLEHLFAVANRIEVVGRTGSVEGSPRTLSLPDGELGPAFRAASQAALAAWSDDATLSRTVSVPWGESSGAATVSGYVGEFVAHGWDLATALGLLSEADPALAEAALKSYDGRLSPQRRGGATPFGPVVDPADDAGPTERLANYLGRRSR